MKRFLFPSLLVILLVSCSLTEHPKDQIPEEQAYTTARQLYQNTVATLYNYIGGDADGQGLQGTCRGVYDLNTFGSDEAMLPTRGGDWYDGGLWQAMYKHSWAPGHDLCKNAWLYLYKVITLCNRSLETLQAHGNLVDAATLRGYQAEVRACRAMYYWYLMDLFGNVPLITSSDVSMSQVTQEKRSVTFAFIVKELQTVLPDLADENSVKSGYYYGRVTRPVACFILAKLMLNAEVYGDDDWTDGQRPDGSRMKFSVDGQTMNAWQATVYYCDKLDASFALMPNYRDNFLVHNETSTENIFVIPMDKNLYRQQQQNLFRSYHYRHAAAYGFTGENGSCATRKVLEVFGYATKAEDPRFGENYFAGPVVDLNGNAVADRGGKQLVYYPTAVEMNLSGSPYVETAGARMRKYEIDKNALKDGKLMDNDIVLFRLADVLLMRAEAKVRMGQAGQADFDRVRSRSTGTHREATLSNILDERLLELAWEGWRRQDLIRFGLFCSLYDGSDRVKEDDGHTTVYPIPADVRAMNVKLVQNKGY